MPAAMRACEQPVGQPVQRRDRGEQARAGSSASLSLSSSANASVSMLGRPGLCEQMIEELIGVFGAMRLRAVLPLQPQERQRLVRQVCRDRTRDERLAQHRASRRPWRRFASAAAASA